MQTHFRRLYITTVSAYHYFELARFAYPLQFAVVEFQLVCRNVERDGAAFSLLQADAFEAFQLFHRAGYAACQIADVQLYYFVRVEVSRIGDGNRSLMLPVVLIESLLR